MESGDLNSDAAPTPHFLNHPGSSVASEILHHQWDKSSLGPPADWPVSLKTTLATMLACPAPMFLAWGPDLICFYNDSYRPILGYRAEKAIGEKFQVLWASLWSDIEPLVKDALAGGSPSVTDMKLDLSRAGVPEESYWTFSYSPAYDDDGRINGMLCVTGETTAKVLAERERKEAAERLELALSAGAIIGTWFWDVAADRFTVDEAFARNFGLDPALGKTGIPLEQIVETVHPDDQGGLSDAINDALARGGRYAHQYRVRRYDGRYYWLEANGHVEKAADGTPLRFPGVLIDIEERRAAERQLRERDDRFRALLSATSNTIYRMSADWQELRRLDDRGVLTTIANAGWLDEYVDPIDQANVMAAVNDAITRKGLFEVEHRGPRSNNTTGWTMSRAVPIFDEHGDILEWFGAASDVTARRQAEADLLSVNETLEERIAHRTSELLKAEEALRQSQKMDAVGQLTGGIAHDFNNMLAIIIGGLNLAKRRLDRGDADITRFIDSSLDGATRAATLTQRLLAFSRQQPLAPESVDLNKLIAGLTDLLTRSLGETVKLEAILGAGLWRAKVDAHQLENVLVNLAVNGRDAMPEGGKLTIETANASVDEGYAREAEIKPGQYLLIAVTDTGTGMTPEVLSKAFDPFFTTKAVGKGTGLGLSQVYGFLRQSEGHVRVYSEPGHGTTVRLYLPRSFDDAVRAAARSTADQTLHGGSPTEIVLVVEDEERLRRLSVEALRELGYTAVHASNGHEALAILRRGQDVSLIFTDVVMPEMTGRQLIDEAHKLRPSVKVLYTTGYTRNAVVHNGVIDPDTNFLPKPFSINQLASKIRDILDHDGPI